MRDAFVTALTERAQDDKNVQLVVGDLGFGVLTDFARAFPAQFLNVGVAEQNMMGISAGMALEGATVFAYSIANFATLRCLEQIRNGICQHRLNVNVVGIGGGLSYGALGSSHHSTEDLAILRALPEMLVVAPGDPLETELATRAVCDVETPSYIRIGRGSVSVHETADIPFELGKALTVRQGADVTLIATGEILGNVVAAAEILAQESVQARVLSMHTVKPIDSEAVLTAAAETGGILTIEEHSRTGGLGSAVAEVLADSCEQPGAFARVALPDRFVSEVGDQDYLRELYRLHPRGIAEAAIACLNEKR